MERSRLVLKKSSSTVLHLIASVSFAHVSKMNPCKEKIRYILQFLFDKGENASQAAESLNSVYGTETVTANHVQFWFRRFRCGNFEVKD